MHQSESEMPEPKSGDVSKRKIVRTGGVAYWIELVKEDLIEDWQNDQQKKMHAMGMCDSAPSRMRRRRLPISRAKGSKTSSSHFNITYLLIQPELVLIESWRTPKLF